ncbi:hypothetical protein [Rhodomicrobium lacus]|jgi:hypothetical protein|uniref:hypothetical protein n=1 Tax=Rhodomicrobium TaxID=1068 RepID=UPI000F8F605F|nr:hypothetical protein [Rhodomicrobium lacus]WKW49924.1 hypothetical protein QMO75_11520 [Rhodomicrobium lacus]
MDFVEKCKLRQAALRDAVKEMDQIPLFGGDELQAARFKQNALKTISLYEKIIHLSKGDTIGHA